MMVVLLIVAIVAAATAPMVTKKMARNVGSGDSPWVFTGLNNNIAYNMSGNDNTTAMIGAASLPSGWNQRTRLFIDSGNNASHIAFGNGNATPLLLTADPENGRVGFSNVTIPNNSVAFGTGQTLNRPEVVAIGTNVSCGVLATAMGFSANANAQQSTAIGALARSTEQASVSVGYSTRATGNRAVSIGSDTLSAGTYSISIGSNVVGGNVTRATQENSIAIGAGAQSTFSRAVAIGAGAETTASDQIVLGTRNDTVYIPGNLIVGRKTYLGINASNNDRNLWMNPGRQNNDSASEGWYRNLRSQGLWQSGGNHNLGTAYYYTSDKRLKNVGDKYTAGLEELKKLDFYHYTFRADKDNTPLVGVIAQDLQKVFPDAVTKGEDGYLRIRLEDMFYAVINAVKELDTKISEIVTAFDSKLESQNQRIESLEKQNSELQKQNEELQKEIKNIEKRIKKLEK